MITISWQKCFHVINTDVSHVPSHNDPPLDHGDVIMTFGLIKNTMFISQTILIPCTISVHIIIWWNCYGDFFLVFSCSFLSSPPLTCFSRDAYQVDHCTLKFFMACSRLNRIVWYLKSCQFSAFHWSHLGGRKWPKTMSMSANYQAVNNGCRFYSSKFRYKTFREN